MHVLLFAVPTFFYVLKLSPRPRISLLERLFHFDKNKVLQKHWIILIFIISKQIWRVLTASEDGELTRLAYFWTNLDHWCHWLESAEHMDPLRRPRASFLLPPPLPSSRPVLSLSVGCSSGPSVELQGLTGSPNPPPGPPRCGAIWCSEMILQGQVVAPPRVFSL